MAEIVYRQMPAPRDIPQKIPAPRAKIRMQKPQSGGEFSVQIPGGARGGMVMAKIDNCITSNPPLSFNAGNQMCGSLYDFNKITHAEAERMKSN